MTVTELFKVLRCEGKTDGKICDCEYWLPTACMCDEVSIMTQAADAIESLQLDLAALREADRWISVEERLPGEFHNENGEPIEFNVMLSSAKVATTLCFDGSQWFDFDWKKMRVSGYYTVTHWKPLPQPPKEGI
jgi:hypothetical protein